MVLIIHSFNSFCNRKGDVSRRLDGADSQWTKEKAEEWFAWMDSDEGSAYIEAQLAIEASRREVAPRAED